MTALFLGVCGATRTGTCPAAARPNVKGGKKARTCLYEREKERERQRETVSCEEDESIHSLH